MYKVIISKNVEYLTMNEFFSKEQRYKLANAS